MDMLGPLFLFCGWHLIVLAVGVAIGHYKPWHWRIVRRPEQSYSPAVSSGGNHQHPQYYELEEDDVFKR